MTKTTSLLQRLVASAVMVAAAAGMVVAAAGMAAVPAHAASVVLWPVDPKIQADQKATAIWVENKSDEPVTLQVRSLGWSQADGEDRYSDQDEVVASPPIAKVEGGKRQLIRLIRRTTGTADAERSYRLLIDELPKPLDPANPAQPTAQLAVQMRYSIPLFTYEGNAASAAPALHSRVELSGGKRYLVIRNSGARHARLVDLRSVEGTRRDTVIPGLIGYVLAGQTMRWALPEQSARSATFEVNVNGADQTLAPTA